MDILNELRNELDNLMWENFAIFKHEPEFIYHYTDIDAAKLIIDTGHFWVSEAFETIDPKEIIHIKEVIKVIINEKYSILETEKMKHCSDFFQHACNLVKKQAFILCFSLDKNSKRMWKTDAKKKGKIRICLRFNFQNITPNPFSEFPFQERYFVDHHGNDIKIKLLNLNHFVTYDNRIKYKKIEEYMNLVYETIKRLSNDNIDEELYKDELALLVDIFTDIFLFACFSKVSKLKKEKEYRMLYLFPDDSKFPLILETRMLDNKKVRYVSMNMKANNTFSLDRIYVKRKYLVIAKRELNPLIEKLSNRIEVKHV